MVINLAFNSLIVLNRKTYLHDNGAAYGPIAGFVFTAILIGVANFPNKFYLTAIVIDYMIR